MPFTNQIARRALAAAGAAFLSMASNAQALQFQGAAVKTIAKVPVYAEAVAKLPTGPAKLYLSGAGERVKTIVLVKIHAYTIASYLDAAKKIDVAAPMKSIQESKVKALHLTFLRDISASRVKSSFQDSLEENGVDPKAPAMAKLLASLDVDVKEKETLDLVGYQKPDGTDAIEFSFPGKTFTAEGKNLVSDFWKIWYGKPADGGLKDLKAQLLGVES